MVEFGKLIFQAIIELVGCLILGIVLSIGKMDAFIAGVLPFLAWIPYMICWKISHAHLNPAVTLVCLLRKDYKDFGIVEGILYMLAQFTGFFLSNFLVWWFVRDVGNLNLWERKDKWQFSEAIGMETVGSFIFILFHTLQLNKQTSLSGNTGLNALVVGTFYGALVYWSYSTTGGSLNPFYGAAKNFVDPMDTGDDKSIENLWVYVIFPFVAALMVWPFYEFIYKKAYNDKDNKQTEIVWATQL